MVTQDIERIAQREGGRHGELYLVTGATGNTGRTTVLRLAALGKRVRAMVRPTANADDFESLKRENVEVVFGDYLNYATLQRAVRGVDYVIATVGVGLERGQNTLDNIEVRGNTWLFEVAKAAGVKHLTLVTVLRADEFPNVPIFAAKKRAEDALKRSGLTYTILRPSGIVSARNLLNEARRVRQGKPLSVFGEGVNRASPILVTDLASLAVKASETPQAWNATFDIGGPQALSGVERIREIGHAVGVEPKIAPPPLVANNSGAPNARPTQPQCARVRRLHRRVGAPRFQRGYAPHRAPLWRAPN